MDKYKIKDICDLNLCTITPKDKYSSILYLDTSSILCNQISNLQIVSIKDAPSRAKRKVKNNTIVYSTVRPNLKHFGIISNPPNNFIVSTGFTTIDIKKEYESTIDARYVFFLLTNQSIVDYLSTMAESAVSAYPSINPDDIGELCFNFPHIDIQKKVASVIFYIDEKIALNSRVNAELEAMAKQLYDYWFVQFDFPDENGKPYKSSGGKMVYNEKLKREIPEGWDVKLLRDLLILEDSRRIPLSNKDREKRKGIYPYYGATGIMDYIDNYIFDGDYILLAEDGSTSDENGNPVVQYIWGKNWVNNHAHIIHVNDDSQLQYYYYLLKTIPVILIETGSIQKKISQENLLRYSVLCPPNRLIRDYCCISSSYREMQKRGKDENYTLYQLRDSILPMLMNGQVTVEE